MKTLLTFIILCMSIAPGLADPVVQIGKQYYAVSGATADSIYEDMIWQSPFRRSGRDYVAETSSHFNWKYTTLETRASCTITDVEVEVVITVTLPQLQNPEKIDQALLENWQQYVESVRVHEQGHVDFAIEAAYELEQKIRVIPSQASCSVLEDIIRQTGKTVLDKYTARDEAYDNESAHGINTGSAFP